jgi:hypothetical protein
MSIQVIDPGPIAFADLVRFEDEADTETRNEAPTLSGSSSCVRS